MPRNTELDPFKNWLLDRGLNRQTVYNYVSRVRAILGVVVNFTDREIDEAMNQLSSANYPKSAFRCAWRHYADFMRARKKVSIPVPKSSISSYKSVQYPQKVAVATKQLIEKYHLDPKILSVAQWQHFTRESVHGNWTLAHPDYPGERWYPAVEDVMTLFEWSSSAQPVDDTPLLAVRGDSKVSLAARGIIKLLRSTG